MSPLHWQFTHFRDLSVEQLYAMLKARQDVFILEQTCLWADLDDKDQDAHHLLGWRDGRFAACVRVLAPGVAYPEEASIGRVLTTRAERGTGAGRALMHEAIRHTTALYPQQRIRIGAQQYLEKFYQSFGFATVSDPYEEDGIMHVEMLR
ncbi:GNAT family N-acetyltransferase [Massilia sp. TS11]|uniref:GNAT family N-acetyltransferase n=1 Tax=Massilia sp. TS11 TaxID=2908003 RepID=UPI001EDAA3AA|nr:GNAT family N-acetyltransferase [Massilia sp. TS11]MCG2585752.1 GNAT family N-acetyltransferase [Massilia sp. TS11]